MAAHTLAKLVPLPSFPVLYFSKNLQPLLKRHGSEILVVLLFLVE